MADEEGEEEAWASAVAVDEFCRFPSGVATRTAIAEGAEAAASSAAVTTRNLPRQYTGKSGPSGTSSPAK